MGNLYALFMMGLLVDKIEGSFVGGGPGATDTCIHETATYESGEVGGICNGTPIEITRQSYDFNVCEYIDDANGPYWTKYYQLVLLHNVFSSLFFPPGDNRTGCRGGNRLLRSSSRPPQDFTTSRPSGWVRNGFRQYYCRGCNSIRF